MTASPPLPRWMRSPPGRGDASFAAGAALALLDPLARDPAPLAQLWRRRLALTAASHIAALEGRTEDPAQLRDHWVLRRPGDDPGPAGRILAAWRALGDEKALRPQDWPDRLPKLFDLPPTPALEGIADLPLRHPLDAAAAIPPLVALGPAYRPLALWVADALLARALNWPQALPLLPGALPRTALRLSGEDLRAACATAWAGAALSARDLHLDLAPRAARLIAAAPKLRGGDAQTIVATLLTEDAVQPQTGAKASDRAARRVFDRLTALGLVRELTGRATFRLYGL